MSKPKVVVDNDPSISVTTDSFVTSFKRSDQSFQFKTLLTGDPIGNYYMVIRLGQIDELVALLKTVKKQISKPKEEV